MSTEAALRVAIIGTGPRGLSVLERLLAKAARESLALSVDVIDPFPPGAGHIWRTDQSPLYLMNTQSFFPTVVPDHTTAYPPLAGSSFDTWRQRFRPELRSEDFPPRAVYGEYLGWVYRQLSENLPEKTRLTWHQDEVLRLRRRPGAGGFQLALASGGELAVEAVVLAIGHVPAKLSPGQRELAEDAARWGLHYQPPAVPADVDWDAYPAGEPVLVRGMGLNFFDVLAQWTEGRGGRFQRTAEGALEYLPSGREPLIIAASRRGGPYRSKPGWSAYYPPGLTMPFLTEALAEINRIRSGSDGEDSSDAAGRVTPGFDHDIWPSLHKDVLRAYYMTLSGRDLPELDRALRTQTWQAACEEWLGQDEDLRDRRGNRFDLRALARPFGQETFTDREQFARAVLHELDADAAASAAGTDDPVKMAIGALNRGRAMIKDQVADGGITDASWLRELLGWFEGLVEGQASGPPALRIEQLAAVTRGGLVRFVGADPIFGSTAEGFWASSPWVAEAPVTARALVEATAPPNRVAHTASPLLAQLLRDGLVRPKTMLAADDVPVVTSGLDVTTPPYRALDIDGAVQQSLYVIGLQLSSVQWGTAIAAQASADYPSGRRTLDDAQAIAEDILGRAQLD
ncbi:FAD/NAD(P)-binding protein [Acaricomes phytoseiuli]|uniref:FAD/NAD(P)-binding protein n=1 Tax=Acaricomes phytoseiuli TaxID=291968 RepID=UPI00037D79F0|nr:FAD/NAD(P)-binding protein [Acaricomes phytoseiuli]